MTSVGLTSAATLSPTSRPISSTQRMVMTLSIRISPTWIRAVNYFNNVTGEFVSG